MKSENTVSVKSEDFALRIVKLYKYLTTRENEREFVMSKQLLRSGTSIGANIAEAEFAISKDDFKAKLYISLKECNESRYWIRLLHKSEFITDNEYQSLYEDCQEILRILIAITKTLKDMVSNHHSCSLLITNYPFSIAHCSLLITHFSLLTTNFSLLTAHCSLLIANY